VDLVPLCVGEDADDDAGGEESGRRANEGAEDQTTAHEDEGEEKDGLAGPAARGDGAVRPGLLIKIEIVPVVEEAPAKVETGEGESNEAQTDGTEVGLVLKKMPSYENPQKSV